MEVYRDRAEGWQHAKLSGHINESNVTEMIKSDFSTQERLIIAAGYSPSCISVEKICVGGLNELNIPCILGDTTKNKTDVKILLSNGKYINISIKKSLGGQVYLITPERFISGFQAIYNIPIPKNIKRAIELFWGVADDINEIIARFPSGDSKIDAYQLRKRRLVERTLRIYDNKLCEELLEWFNNHMEYIFDFCFARGLARDESESADLIWYINTLGENQVDEIINIARVKENIPRNASYGTRGGGTTIQLPFGFVQWHDPSKSSPCLQFHHGYEKIISLIEGL